MDPATLYLLLQFSSGSERVQVLHFRSVRACEEAFQRIDATRAKRFEIKRHACWPHGTWPPDWVSQQPIVGVPVLEQDLER